MARWKEEKRSTPSARVLVLLVLVLLDDGHDEVGSSAMADAAVAMAGSSAKRRKSSRPPLLLLPGGIEIDRSIAPVDVQWDALADMSFGCTHQRCEGIALEARFRVQM